MHRSEHNWRSKIMRGCMMRMRTSFTLHDSFHYLCVFTTPMIEPGFKLLGACTQVLRVGCKHWFRILELRYGWLLLHSCLVLCKHVSDLLQQEINLNKLPRQTNT